LEVKTELTSEIDATPDDRHLPDRFYVPFEFAVHHAS